MKWKDPQLFLAGVAEQLNTDVTLMEAARKSMTPEQAAEMNVDQAIVRGRELAEKARQLAYEGREMGIPHP
ncbi:MAG: hypothetical protein FWH27_14440 [Planctomycetaceae bacterium]|nr:hypothetical protein [Planctomycetaceae bacterium]